mgnify:CR=1 FL=1
MIKVDLCWPVVATIQWRSEVVFGARRWSAAFGSARWHSAVLSGEGAAAYLPGGGRHAAVEFDDLDSRAQQPILHDVEEGNELREDDGLGRGIVLSHRVELLHQRLWDG